MPFGLRNAAQTFQRFMDEVLRGLQFSYAYVDDVLIASATPEEHKQHLRLVLERFQKYGIVVNPSKCKLGVTTLEFLGHKVTKHGIEPLEERVQALQQFPLPDTQRKLREFFGADQLLPSFCTELCRHFATTQCNAFSLFSK